MEEEEITEFKLPPASGLSFDENIFLKENFSIEEFIKEYKDVSLETLRDDLGVYLKVLRLAMIDVINKDYAKFLNLSSMLVGFDKTIDQIRLPVEEMNNEIGNVKEEISQEIRELTMLLSKTKSLRLEDLSEKHFKLSENCLQSLKSIMEELQTKKPEEVSLLVDRAAIVYNQLLFSTSKCELHLKQEHHDLTKEMGDKLILSINNLIFNYLKSKDENSLLKAFLALASLGKVSETETLIKKQVIAPCLENLISESNLQKGKGGLVSMYNKIISLLDNDLKMLFKVMTLPKLRMLNNGYNFFVNCFWCEVETRLEVNLSSIFAPGNPNIFYERYTESMNFLKKLEELCNDPKAIRDLRVSAQYQSFQKRWNLPVYFQIRFQEIAGNYETTLHQPPVLNTESSEFILKQTTVFWKATSDCWTDGIFILKLGHKFWKLSLQFISRYVTWVKDYCNQRPKIAKDQTVMINKELIENNLSIYIDIQRILERLPNFLEIVQNKLQVHKKELTEKCLDISKQHLTELKPNIRECIVNELFFYYSVQLKQVSDIPRLYRKTNRSVPTRPCLYIESVSSSIISFKKDFSNKIDDDFLADIFQQLFLMMTDSYHKAVEDVLTSVQKTEESLRRLKQIREKTPQQVDSNTISDGDKIRLQLNVDVKAYTKLLKDTHGNVHSFVKLDDLNILVSNAIKDINNK